MRSWRNMRAWRLCVLVGMTASILVPGVDCFSGGITSTRRMTTLTTTTTTASIIRSGMELRESAANNNDNDDRTTKRPTTSFGADAVPEAQRPANEYLDLRNQPLFDWASQESGTSGLAIRLFVLYAVTFAAICYPIAGATYTGEGFEVQKLVASNVGALGFLLAVLLRLYTGWGYVGSRLQSKVVEYEETGWYDGDFERKTEAESARDLFLYRQNVKPVLTRLQQASIGCGAVWVASCIGLQVVTSQKPIFNEYDPTLLERLPYDEKLAGVAAKQSNGRPTYCDSRYYRAVANGGQGC
jgi:hypothetical protein